MVRFLNDGAIDDVRSQSAGVGGQATIVFLGISADFSDRLLDIVRREIADIKVVRIASLRQLRSVAGDTQNDIRLLIVSESRASDMSARVDVYGQVVKKGCLVLAYEDVATARAMREFLSSRNDAPCMRYLPMRCSVDAWLLYLQALLSREWIIPEELVNGSVPRPEQPVSQSGKGAVVPRLTSREREVLKRVSEGLRNKSIAHDLGLSEHTVKLHLHNVFAKIGVDNRAHATAWYMARMGSAQDDGQGRN